MLARAGRVSLSMACAVLGMTFLTGCSSFPLKYQNYFTTNFAYFASNYDGNPADNLSAGAESNNFEGGNEASYSAAKVPHVITGFRTLQYQNTNYHRAGHFDFQFSAFLIPPGKGDADAVHLGSFILDGKSLNSQPLAPEVSKIVLIKMSYPAPMIYLDSKALQAKYGSGEYTVFWKATSEDGQATNREMARVTTSLVP